MTPEATRRSRDPSGDGDGDPAGDGDGDPSGDGDGDPSGDGDGDPILPQCDDGVPTVGEICYGDSVLVNGGDVVYAAHLVDITTDGEPDIVYLLGDGTIRFHVNTGGGVFATGTDKSFCNGAMFMEPANLNGDARADLVCGYFNTIQTMLGDGTGGFTQGVSVGVATELTAMWVGPFDGDNDPDVVSASDLDPSPGNSVRLDLSNGTGEFLIPPFTANPSGERINAIAAVDFTNDGLPEAVFGTANGLQVRPGMGTAIGFGSNYNTGVNANVTALGIGDFDDDGKPDIVYSNGPANNVGWVMGAGAGASVSPVQVGCPGGPRRIAVADFDNDGFDDFAVGTGANRVWIYRSLGDEGFADPIEIPVAVPVDSLEAGPDANGDGVPDLILSNVDADTAVVLLSTP